MPEPSTLSVTGYKLAKLDQQGALLLQFKYVSSSKQDAADARQSSFFVLNKHSALELAEKLTQAAGQLGGG